MKYRRSVIVDNSLPWLIAQTFSHAHGRRCRLRPLAIQGFGSRWRTNNCTKRHRLSTLNNCIVAAAWNASLLAIGMQIYRLFGFFLIRLFSSSLFRSQLRHSRRLQGLVNKQSSRKLLGAHDGRVLDSAFRGRLRIGYSKNWPSCRLQKEANCMSNLRVQLNHKCNV